MPAAELTVPNREYVVVYRYPPLLGKITAKISLINARVLINIYGIGLYLTPKLFAVGCFAVIMRIHVRSRVGQGVSYSS